ncbi:hypothetical protein JXB22_03135 [candidate division WOR-3 bacterium]|nr:hypothetical protein [candidate division WOR-3 bacterium]
MKGFKDLNAIIKKDRRYRFEAYIFVLQAIDYTHRSLHKKRHVTGQELLEGIRELAVREYGLLAKAVFAHWGVKRTADFGNIVFNMVNAEILSKTDQDDIRDFENVYDFDEVFVTSYELHINRQHDH